MDEHTMGYVFAGQSLTYLLACLVYPFTFEHLPRKLQFLIGMIGLALCHLLMGPSDLVSLPDETWITVSGMILTGAFQAAIFIPVIPEMIERLQVALNVSDTDEDLFGKLSDKVNDGYGFVYSLSEFLAPLLGS